MVRTQQAQQKLQNLMNELEEIAAHNLTRSSDVVKLLATIQDRVDRYLTYLNKIVEGGQVTRRQYTKMKAMELDIIRSAIRMSEFDRIVSDEEDAILKHLEQFILTLDQ